MKQSPWRFLWRAPDIRNKLLITLLILVIYRLLANIPVPGVNRVVLQQIATSGGAGGNFVNLLDLLSGGTISNFSILAMAVYPYITAQIILQLLVPIVPAWQRRFQDNPREGQQWMERWTMILSIPMALLSSIGQINILRSLTSQNLFTFNFGLSGGAVLPTITVIITMTAGTMLGIWLGQLISEFGIPNQGLSLIIFAGIVARIPQNLGAILADQNGVWMLIAILFIFLLIIFAILFVQQGQRNVPVLFPGRRVGNRMSMPVRSNLPLMVNMAGMIPLIFAQAMLSFPSIVSGFFVNSGTEWLRNAANSVIQFFNLQGAAYSILYFVLVVAFTYFYTDVLFQQQSYGESLKRQGAQIPGVIRGDATQDYLSRVQRRITLPGALFLGIVAVLPAILALFFPGASRTGLFLTSSAGLLIVVGVVRDTFNIIDAELKVHGHDVSLVHG
jgi:preprotein translocase subunit SecY